jgi:hypothetical protein
MILIVGADAYSVLNYQPVQLNEGEFFCVHQNYITGGITCEKTWSILGSTDCTAGLNIDTVTNPTVEELDSLCQVKQSRGIFGASLSGLLNTAGSISGNETLSTVRVESWQIFILMIVTTFLVWAITASTRS